MLEDLIQMGPEELMVKDKNGNTVTYKGVNLSKVLEKAGAPTGDRIRGENLAKYILIHAKDGYQAVFSITEVDSSFSDKMVLLAFQQDGNPLPPGIGPFRLVVLHEKKQARWVREVMEIEIKMAHE
ncbi:molybdopterin-dependent oxidoreductase [Cyclobacterium plantarum]|uniref:Molybdopterin-dependent oxidoreductase n=1 Tax=Cyclobacterium plantarum TaxID=2716263 RepID=A0ABX0H4J1_9BACT|nr:molybdopterin-dependent oxidoreductase [Cyclobacterium plantarum]NHE56760.1 molybdopterin-dependent oxidoreductase [Cyclobacterium plantarum]